MSRLRVFAESDSDNILLDTSEETHIAQVLSNIGISFERWVANKPLPIDAKQADVIDAYAHDIERLTRQGCYKSVDVISMRADHPDKVALRAKFLNEHRHAEDEVRFFVDGQGLFSIHSDSRVFEVLCCQGDLIRVPANTAHWFDMGENPSFTAIRLFCNPDGWVAHFTGSDIAQRFHRLNT